MDSLASLDLEKEHRKSHRVRSWYWYEQYKSLEDNQLDATLQLRNKSHQQKILRQELDERRARRRLCDNSRVTQSEPKFNKYSGNCCPNTTNASTDDIFQSFCELHDESELTNEFYSYEDSNTSKNYDDFKSMDNIQSDDSSSDCVNSIVDNSKYKDNLDTDIREELTLVKQNIADNLNLHLDTVEENIKRLEKYTKICDGCKSSDLETPCELSRCGELELKDKKGKAEVNTVLLAWSKLVTFSHQLIQLNHGNCYFDFSSQFLTAVLACDVLRRGITRISLRLPNKVCY